MSCHCFRRSFATHRLENGIDIRTIQELMGHKDDSTTMIYVYVMSKASSGYKVRRTSKAVMVLRERRRFLLAPAPASQLRLRLMLY